MIRSMTGYGYGRAKVNGLVFTVEIRAVNHRYADICVKAPRLLLAFEAEVKKQVSTALKRGKIDVFINQESTEDSGTVPVLNQKVAQAYVDLFRQMQLQYELGGDIPLEVLINQKDVLSIKELAIDADDLRLSLRQAVDQALTGAVQMRKTEGQATLVDIQSRLLLVNESLARIAARSPLVPGEWQQKLADRLQRLSEDRVDDQRIAQELALFADRCDISEELSRFQSHLQQFADLFEQDEPVGRQLDFLLQELNRETNTMGSKSNDADLTRNVVSIKAELEKIREQVQNVE